MPKKELSNYAPDRWIRYLNRQYPNLWTDIRKGYEHPEGFIRRDTGGMELLRSVPDWCYMPTLFPFLVLTHKYGEAFYLTHMEEMMTIGTLYTWRASKGVYRFAPEIYDALISQPLSGNIPTDCLYHLPEWAVFVETPGMTYERHPITGFIAHLDYNLFSKGIDLQFAIFSDEIHIPKMIALPLGEGTISDAMDRVDATDNLFMPPNDSSRYVGSRDEYKKTFSSMLQLLLYLCSEEPDMPQIEHPQKRRTISGGVRSPKEPQVWDVGVRVSNAIRNYKNHERTAEKEMASVQGVHSSPRPHVRAAHWHTFWVGPRSAKFPDRKPIIRWLPPIPIGMDWRRELPTNIHMVLES